jgi:hypothetical protein
MSVIPLGSHIDDQLVLGAPIIHLSCKERETIIAARHKAMDRQEKRK